MCLPGRTMKKVLVIIAVFFGVGALWSLWNGRHHPRRINADVAVDVRPTKVILLDEDREGEEPVEQGRTGETQELERKLVHGPYRPIEDAGLPTKVRRKQS